MAEFLNRVLIRGLNLIVDHFFDFFPADIPECSRTSVFCLTETFALLGFQLDPEKTQVLSEVAEILGVCYTRALKTERFLSVEPKSSRRQNFAIMVDKILPRGEFIPSVAASLLGKYQFLCSTLFGKVGRFCTSYVRRRQYSGSDAVQITPEIRLSLKLMKHLVTSAPVRLCQFGRKEPPLLLYTDASDSLGV